MKDLNFIKNNFNVKTFEDFQEHIELQCDALVIGSGAGGAPLACRLAESGVDTILIEEGGYFLTKDFKYSRLSFAMLSIEISLGHSASHDPVLVQCPKPSSSI